MWVYEKELNDMPGKSMNSLPITISINLKNHPKIDHKEKLMYYCSYFKHLNHDLDCFANARKDDELDKFKEMAKFKFSHLKTINEA